MPEAIADHTLVRPENDALFGAKLDGLDIADGVLDEPVSVAPENDLIRFLASNATTKHGFFVRMGDDSMRPWRKPGDLVFVNTDRDPQPGEYVIAFMRAFGSDRRQIRLVRRLVSYTGGIATFAQYNPAQEQTVADDDVIGEVEFMLRVVDWSEIFDLWNGQAPSDVAAVLS